MDTCRGCKTKYPSELLWLDECGICALARTNQMLGIERTSFHAPMAEEMRQGAIAWRKEHGE